MTSYLTAAEELRSNPNQWAAYEASGNCVVLAGPGSGKTKVLTAKLARLLAEEVQQPRGIACVTYSTECARELRRRLDRLGVGDSRYLFVGTLHGFCLQHVLRAHGSMAGGVTPGRLVVAGLLQQRRIIEESRKALGMGANPKLRAMFDVFRRDNLEVEAWDLTDEVAKLAWEYEARLAREAAIDFEIMTREAVVLVERNEWVRRCLRARFPVLVVDEYQDLGLALHRLVLSLCLEAGVRLIAVGDPDQSIYGFTGAHPEHIAGLARDPRVTPFRLGLNYRSGKKIVAAARATLDATTEFAATRDAESVVAYPRCEGGIEGQAAHLVEGLLPDVLERWKPGDVLITFRSKNEGDPVEQALRAAKYDYVKIGSTAAYPKAPLTRLVEECARWCAGGWREGDPKLSRLARIWISLQGLVEPDEVRVERLKLVRFLFDHRGAETPAEVWIRAFETDVVGTHDARARLMSNGDLESFDTLMEAVKPGNALAGYSARNLGGQAGSPDHLNLVTLHSSKGTEFPVVIVVGADEGSFPWATARPGSQEEAEDRRLFYVGISRAMDELYILWSPPVPGDKSRQGPSRFLREMHEGLKAAATGDEGT